MIEVFRGDNFFLSNMKPLETFIPTTVGVLVPTAEHAYQAAKFKDPEVARTIAEARADPNDTRPFADGVTSKDLAHEYIDCGLTIRSDWETAKYGVMAVIVKNKFLLNGDLADRLLATGDQDLVEGNAWGDRYWGVDPIGSINGQNHLGEILMRVRDELIMDRIV